MPNKYNFKKSSTTFRELQYTCLPYAQETHNEITHHQLNRSAFVTRKNQQRTFNTRTDFTNSYNNKQIL